MFKATFLGIWACGLVWAQADQMARKEQENKKPAAPVIDLSGRAPVDAAAVARGKALFQPACGFCHGMDARGKSGPDLLRSTLVLHDEKGEMIGPMIHAGRPDRGMPAFANMTEAQVGDIAAFLHSGTGGISNRFGYEIKGLMTGDAKQGEAFFRGAGKCTSCHAAGGDLAHVATKYEAVELQRRLLYPAPNLIDVWMGKAVKPAAPTKVKVTLPAGETVSGTLAHADEFNVELVDGGGWHRSFDREQVTKVEMDDPRAAHEALIARYTDAEMHNMLAYLETLK